MRVTLQPRLQVERFSLYWKESLHTDTRCLPALVVEAQPADTVEALLARASTQLDWQPVDQLLRLDGFEEPWERAICLGRELELGQTLHDALSAAKAGKDTPPVITYVRKVLKADGWKIRLPGDFLSDSDSDDEQ